MSKDDYEKEHLIASASGSGGFTYPPEMEQMYQ